MPTTSFIYFIQTKLNPIISFLLLSSRSNRSYCSNGESQIDPVEYDVATRIWDGRWHLVAHSKLPTWLQARFPIDLSSLDSDWLTDKRSILLSDSAIYHFESKSKG